MLQPDLAYAYLGPGLGVGAIGSVVAVIGAFLLALFAVVYYPIKRALIKRRGAKQSNPAVAADEKTVADR